MSRLKVAKTYKLFIGGKFPRSESGRVFELLDAKGRLIANAAKASRKDARDAVVAARAAQPGWASATAFNRSQVLYRIAEMLEGRSEQFVVELMEQGGASRKQATAEVERAIDSWVWHAGWCDKIDAVSGSMNPVAGPFFNISTHQPTGVVAAIAEPGLLGLVQAVAPAILLGNTVVAVAQGAPLSAISFAEVLATSDLPGGVVNILTGDSSELAPWLASHMDVNAIDLSGAAALDWAALEDQAAENLKRVLRPAPGSASGSAASPGSLERILAFSEVKTVWHTKGY